MNETRFMNQFGCPFSLLNSLVLASLIFTGLSAQEKKLTDRVQGIEDRLEAIESRLQKIENVLFASIKYSESEAKRLFDEAKERLVSSQKLYARSMIDDATLALDRLLYRRAETLLRMCRDNEDHQRIGATLQVFDAERIHQARIIEVQRAEDLYKKGFGSQEDILRARDVLLLAAQRLKVAKTKLKELDSLKPKNNSDSNPKNSLKSKQDAEKENSQTSDK